MTAMRSRIHLFGSEQFDFTVRVWLTINGLSPHDASIFLYA